MENGGPVFNGQTHEIRGAMQGPENHYKTGETAKYQDMFLAGFLLNFEQAFFALPSNCLTVNSLQQPMEESYSDSEGCTIKNSHSMHLSLHWMS